MKTFLRYGLILASVITSALAADQAVIRVVGSADLQLAIVDSARATPSREAMHKAFAASLGKAVGDAFGGKATVQFRVLPADQAAFGLSTGRFHVVLAIGKTLPRALMVGGMSRLNATLGADKSQQVADLIFSSEDPGLSKLLNESFSTALSDSHFLDALDGGLENATGPVKGPTLASNTP